MFIVGKIKTYLLAILAILLPVLYVLGRKDGRKIAERDELADDLLAEGKAKDFYKAMAEYEEEFHPTNNSDIADRLREHGL